jgi:hypothetical protein
MTDTTQAGGDTPAKEKRGKIAERDWVNVNGEVVDAHAEATGARYTYLGSGTSLERQFGEPGTPATLCAVMGWLTKVGNIVNTIVNAPDYDGVTDPIPEAAEWDAGLEKGIWREPGEGTARGPKYDKDVLAGALLDVLAEKAAGDFAHYRERLEDRGYYAKVRGNPAIMVRYMQRMAEKGTATGTDVGALA